MAWSDTRPAKPFQSRPGDRKRVLRPMGMVIYLWVRGRVGPFSLNYSMGTLTEDPDTPALLSYNFLLYPGRFGMRGG